MDKKLTIEEKMKLQTGKNLWETNELNNEMPTFFMSDGPHGLRKMKFNGQYWEDIPSIAYINNVNLANTWNTQLAEKQGLLISEDCIEHDVDVLLAPGVNIKRNVLCGRNFEYFSEDPYLSGNMAKSFIDGLQSNGVGACIKHFCANNREIRRSSQSSELDERTLHEIYLEAFRIAFKAKPFAVMMSYNPVNGIYATENKYLMKDILRKEYKYDGLIISDWFAVHNSAKALKAGLNLRMPYEDKALVQLQDAYKKGIISEKDLDESTKYLFEALKKVEENKKIRKIEHNKEERLKEALSIAEESIVLLKNNGVLPLKLKDNVAVISELDARPYIGGGGSSSVRSEIIQKRLSNLLKENGINATNSKYYFLDPCNPSNNIRESIELAMNNDVSIVLVGEDKNIEGEGFDRTSYQLSEREETLIHNVAKNGNKTIVVIEAGSAIDVSSWIDEVDAIIFAGYLGDVANQAIANVLLGKTNPSGKLSQTFPLSLEDNFINLSAGDGNKEYYEDRIFVGYRYYDIEELDVMFPFGYGLSYSKFNYSNLKINKIDETTYEVSYDVTNTSDVDGKEISQIYVKDVTSMVDREEKSLKGFSKDFIKAGETKRVSVVLDKHAFSYYDVNNHEYYVENGKFEIMVGSSSRDIHLLDSIIIKLDDDEQHSIY